MEACAEEDGNWRLLLQLAIIPIAMQTMVRGFVLFICKN
jgi:hypothetical protein